ncbi:MAG: bifunctional enoyl-CoA hydratase/phosphate acetyltransferase [Rhodocyclaceae bacterium]|nr:bifunctional enoyl-CoA hydratase/phosphate acetyltransferase [Rhodocyclaceae bacterium]MDZ4213446.1 bifunctional enoyl-CoA hydratase/phosphate acetyltransferase [Rhodocyclaceae bacterium]
MSTPQLLEYIENRVYNEINEGDTSTLIRTLRPEDIQMYAILSGDMNPTHVDPEYARSSEFREVVAHGMWGGMLFSNVLGTQFPGPGTVYIDQSLHFEHSVRVGDTLTVTVTCKRKFDHNHHIIFDCDCKNQDDERVIYGTAEVIAPTEKIKRAKVALPELRLSATKSSRYEHLLEITSGLSAIPMAVIHPCDGESLKGALQARDRGLIDPTLVGPEDKIRALAEELKLDLHGCTFLNVPHSHAAAESGVALAREGAVEALMKGSLHTDELMGEVIDKATGLRTERRISHVFMMDVPTYPRPLLITDAAINVAPDLVTKIDIVQNAIDLALCLKIKDPKVAILAAVETVNPKMIATLDAAALCKMADRGQIKGGLLDGPLAFDNAISVVAARTKGIKSVVAGQADILLVPDIESGNMLAKQLEYLADALGAGIVLGARVPIVLTSRADSAQTRTASTALAVVLAHAQRAKKTGANNG